ncbi:MAG: cache domain-containing protein [Campylobacterota bacterium]|nr:cache domain-containing protein [Campylobacterota bacterium]
MKNKSIKNMFKLNILQKVVLLFTVLFMGYIVSIGVFALPKINNTMQSLEKKSAIQVLNKITTISKYTIEDLETYKINSLNRYKNELKTKVNIVWNYIDAKYNQIESNKTSEELKQEVLKMVLKMNTKDTVFAIIDYNSIILSHPLAQGVDASKNTDIKGEYSINIMADIAQIKGEGFHTFWYYEHKHKYTKKSYQKLNFVKNYPNWNFFVSTGVFLNKIQDTLDKRKDELFTQLQDIVEEVTIAKTGYVYIFDKTGKIIIHPNETMIGKSIDNKLKTDLVDVSKSSKELISNDKIYWTEPIPELKLYIVSVTNIDEFEESSKILNNNIISLGFIIFIIAISVSIITFRKFLKPLLLLSKLTNKVRAGDLTIRSTIDTDDEIGALSKDFNNMIETIEANQYKDKLLFQQSKLASMGEMIGNIAHQWRQPINRVNLNLAVIESCLEDRDIDKKLIKNKIDASQNNIIYMSNTIDDFSNFFHPNKKMEKCNIENTINKTIKILGTRLLNIDLNINSKEKILFKTFENELIQVLLIIFNNSIDNFEEKKIENPKLDIAIVLDENNLILEISDNGLGIDKEHIDKIFEPYFTTKFKSEGTGIGLYIAKMLIEESMNGTLEATSNNSGTTFSIKLPSSV